MIYLIGGPPRAGKSILAHKISKRNRCPEISSDWLRSVILPYLDGANRTAIQDILFQSAHVDTDEAPIVWPAVKSFVEDKARWQGDFVVDGIHLLPEYLATFGGQIKANISIIFLVKTDEGKILEGFDKVRVRKNDWLLKRHADDPSYLQRVASDIAKRGRYIEAEAKKYGFRVINTQDNFGNQLDTLTEEFFQTRKALRALERRLKSS